MLWYSPYTNFTGSYLFTKWVWKTHLQYHLFIFPCPVSEFGSHITKILKRWSLHTSHQISCTYKIRILLLWKYILTLHFKRRWFLSRIRSLQWPRYVAVLLVPIRFRRMGQDRMVSTLTTAMDGWDVFKFLWWSIDYWHPPYEAICPSWYLTFCLGTVACYHVSFIYKMLYIEFL